jgi:hypothetical protein
MGVGEENFPSQAKRGNETTLIHRRAQVFFLVRKKEPAWRV